MFKGQTLRDLMVERLTAATEEIFELFEKTIAEFEEELLRSKEENQRKQRLLDSVLAPSIHLQKAGAQVPSSSPETILTKEITQIPRTNEESKEEEQLYSTSYKSTDFGMREQSSTPQQRQTERRNETQEEDNKSGSECDIQTENSSDSDDDEDWKHKVSPHSETVVNGQAQIRGNKSGQKDSALVNNGVMLGTDRGDKCKKPPSQKRRKADEGDKRKKHQCAVCKKKYKYKMDLRVHSRVHSGETYFRCPICKKKFSQRGDLELHQRGHAKEKPHRCSICKKTFSQRENRDLHQRRHTKRETCRSM